MKATEDFINENNLGEVASAYQAYYYGDSEITNGKEVKKERLSSPLDAFIDGFRYAQTLNKT